MTNNATPDSAKPDNTMSDPDATKTGMTQASTAAETAAPKADAAVLGRRDMFVAVGCGLFVAGMVGMAYAAVPLYDWFCRATGFNGTTQVATVAPSGELGRKVTVRFDANIGPGLPWAFKPEQNTIEVRLGEVATVHYRVVNRAARPITATAAYNVAPLAVGGYFNKINCFCFTEQSLKAGETREMAVVFYVDPAMAKDIDGADVDTITLSYTFYQQRDPAPPPAGAPASHRGQT